MKNKPATWASIPKGTTFKVVSNSNSHNYPMETVLRTNKICKAKAGVVVGGYNTLSINDVEFIPMTIKDLEERLYRLEAEAQELDKKIEFCKSMNLTEFDEDYYKIYNTLSILETKKTKKEKTVLIKNLIKNLD